MHRLAKRKWTGRVVFYYLVILIQGIFIFFFNSSFYFIHIFCRRKAFWFYTSFQEHISNGGIVVNMFFGNILFSFQVFFQYIMTGEFCGEVFC